MKILVQKGLQLCVGTYANAGGDISYLMPTSKSQCILKHVARVQYLLVTGIRVCTAIFARVLKSDITHLYIP